MFATRLKNNVDNYEQFKRDFSFDNSNTEQMNKYCIGSGYGLPPTMCYYVYDMLSDTEVYDSCYTAMGKSFRFENKNKKKIWR